jgi:hypothetical protein
MSPHFLFLDSVRGESLKLHLMLPDAKKVPEPAVIFDHIFYTATAAEKPYY